MSGRIPAASFLAFDTFGTAVGLAVVAGGLSLVTPWFGALAGTLAALALAGWASLRFRNRGRRSPVGAKGRGVALAAVALAAAVYIEPPAPLTSLRALLLGLGLVPLWAAERRSPRNGPERDGGR